MVTSSKYLVNIEDIFYLFEAGVTRETKAQIKTGRNESLNSTQALTNFGQNLRWKMSWLVSPAQLCAVWGNINLSLPTPAKPE